MEGNNPVCDFDRFIFNPVAFMPPFTMSRAATVQMPRQDLIWRVYRR